MPRALFIVDRNFNSSHIGVRRVIHHYIELAHMSGYTSDLAFPYEGKLFQLKNPFNNGEPFESNMISEKVLSLIQNSHLNSIKKRCDSSIDPGQYNKVIITNPWLCSEGIPKMRNACGIVHDMIPNLLATGMLNFGRHQNIYDMAHRHAIGYKYYTEVCDKIICVSQSTKRDFLLFFENINPERITVHIPFHQKPAPLKKSPKTDILLINALDWRKNIINIISSLKILSSDIKGAHISIVGRERIPTHEALRLISILRSCNYSVKWQRDASESVLANLYSQSNLLFFPSLYEGLGLPVLESQNAGTPAITSNTSSLTEINANKHMMFDPQNCSAMAAAMLSIINNSSPETLKGSALKENQRHTLIGNYFNFFTTK
jgi:glycosyltransferase involved in cell wall biosynthesis